MKEDGQVRHVSSASLGGPGLADSARCSQAAAEALATAAGPGLRLSSLSLDLAGHAMGRGDVEITTRIDKRTRAIVFASVEARVADALVFSAQGLFSPAGGRS
jgi:hypothetical protein